jgi:hypothetical protein
MYIKKPVRRGTVAVGPTGFLTMSVGAANVVRADDGVGTTTVILQSADATAQPQALENSSLAKFGSQTIHVHWDPPSSDGYSPITNDRVEVQLSGWLLKSGLVPRDATDHYSWGWSTGNTYDVTVKAVSKAGDGFPCTKRIWFV